MINFSAQTSVMCQFMYVLYVLYFRIFRLISNYFKTKKDQSYLVNMKFLVEMTCPQMKLF